MRASLALVLLIPHLSGCFHYVPVSNRAVPSGTEVVLDISDRGRVAFSELLGPGVLWLGGQVLESMDTSLVLSVTTIQFLNMAVPTTWTGERIDVAHDFISQVRERELSRTRTALMAGLAVALTAVVTTLALTGFGVDPPGDRPGNGNGDDQ